MVQEGDAVRARVEAEMASGLRRAGARQLCMVVAGMMREGMGAAVQSMRLNLACEKRDGERRELADVPA